MRISFFALRFLYALRMVICVALSSVFCASAQASEPDAKSIKEILLPYRYPIKKQTVRVGKETLDIAYVEQGAVGDKRETIVFAHGWSSYLPAWDKTIEGLSKRYRCIALDFPGYGRSGTSYRVGIQYYAEVLAAFIQELRLGAVTIAGHSMGGQVAMTLALKHPRMVKRLVLISPTGIETFTEPQRRLINRLFTDKYSQRKDESAIQNDFERVFFRFPSDAAFMVRDRVAMRSAFDFDTHCSVLTKCAHSIVNENAFDKIGAIKHPTLIIFGVEDNIIPNALFNPMLTTQDVGVLAQKKIKRSKLLILSECGHFAQYDKPDSVNHAIEDFIR